MNRRLYDDFVKSAWSLPKAKEDVLNPDPYAYQRAVRAAKEASAIARGELKPNRHTIEALEEAERGGGKIYRNMTAAEVTRAILEDKG